MKIDKQDKQKARDYERQLEVMQTQIKNMRVWFSTLASSTEPGEVECVCVHKGPCCRKGVGGGLVCSRIKGHYGPCVACGGEHHDITGALKREEERIDLGENNPDVRPEWWRELEHLEVIEPSDVFKNDSGAWVLTNCVGHHHETREMRLPDAGLLCHLPHYRLRPWRDMEDGEVLCEGDEWLNGAGEWKPAELLAYHVHGGRYRTRRPKPVRYGGYVPPECLASEPGFLKEPDLRLPDGTDISGWPVIEAGELMYTGDAFSRLGRPWVVYENLLGPIKITRGDIEAGNSARRRVLPCRHCGGEAELMTPENAGSNFHWRCDCGQSGPDGDKGAVKWNEQNWISGERSEKEEV